MSEAAVQSHAAADAAPARAAGSSFYTAMRILPRHQREAMFEIYAFCRAVDDIADSDAPRDLRRRDLDIWRARVEGIYGGRAPADVAGLARAVRGFDLRKEDFLAVIDGMAMDADADIRGPDWATLDLYCDRVASAVGRLSVRVFGLPEIDGLALSHHLGRALQLTNILRDIDEDAGIGRMYLPAEELAKAGVDPSDPVKAALNPALGLVCEAVAQRAQTHFAEADAIMARNPHRLVKAPKIMEAVYRTILAGMRERGFAPPRERVRVGKGRLLLICLRYAII